MLGAERFAKYKESRGEDGVIDPGQSTASLRVPAYLRDSNDGAL